MKFNQKLYILTDIFQIKKIICSIPLSEYIYPTLRYDYSSLFVFFLIFQ